MKKTIALITAFLLCAALTACQPTPDVAPVVNKAEGIENQTFAKNLSPGETKDIGAPARWNESFIRQDGILEVKANAKVSIPDSLSNTPIILLKQAPLSDQQLAKLSGYFANGKNLYLPPPLTKDEYATQLGKAQNAVGAYAAFEADGRAKIMEKFDANIQLAPDVEEREYTDTVFTLPTEDFGTHVMRLGYGSDYKEQLANVHFSAYIDNSEELNPKLSATTYDKNVGTASNFTFSYTGTMWSRSDIESQQTLYSSLNTEAFSDVYAGYVTDYLNYLSDVQKLTENIEDTPDDAIALSQKTITELDIDHMKLADIQPGVYAPSPPNDFDTLNTDLRKAQSGYYITFSRAAGQLQGAVYQTYGFYPFTNGMKAEQTFIPPFHMEYVKIFASKDRILLFDWQNMAQKEKILTENSKILPWEEISKRFVDFITFAYAIPGGTGSTPEPSVVRRVEILEAKLLADYIPAKDKPEMVWMVPVWQYKVQLYDIVDGKNEKPGAVVYYRLNAIDGGIIQK